jgi:hypothetical protein
MISHDVSWIVDPRCAFSEDSGSSAPGLLFKIWGSMKALGNIQGVEFLILCSLDPTRGAKTDACNPPLSPPPSINPQLYRITCPSAATGTIITLIFLPMSCAVHVCVSLCLESGISSHSSLMFSFTISGSCLPVSGRMIQNLTVRVCCSEWLSRREAKGGGKKHGVAHA